MGTIVHRLASIRFGSITTIAGGGLGVGNLALQVGYLLALPKNGYVFNRAARARSHCIDSKSRWR
jgi:hypothetical protein